MLLLVIANALPGIASADTDVVDQLRQLREQSVLLPGPEAKSRLAAEWEKHEPGTLVHRQRELTRLRQLGKQLAADQNAGDNRDCSEQIFLETKWRVLYTADFPAIDRRLRDLATSLTQKDQAFATRQSSVDGSWGACFEEAFMKVEQSMLSLQSLSAVNVMPKYKVKMAPGIRTGDDVIAILSRLVISDIALNGIDHRSSLAALTSDSAEFAFKDYWQAYLENDVVGLVRDRDPGGISALRAEIRRFVDAWQDPATGYWGAWYRIDGHLYRTTDLSITFHLISYLRGDINYWPQIIATTFAIENDPYPYGWRYGGGLNNHNNYDVVKIFRLAWSHMTATQRQLAQAKIGAMLDWALTKSLRPDGSFVSDEDFFSSADADFYFGVSFLDETGYWRAKKRFWTDATFPDSDDHCRLIRRRLADLQLKSPEALATIEKLQDSCGEPASGQ